MRIAFKIIIAVIATGWLLIYCGEVGAVPPESAPGVRSRGNIEYKAEDLLDPFIDYKAEKSEEEARKAEELKPLPPLVVQGMVWGGSFPQAIINNKVLKIGDTIDGVRIKTIGKDGISVIFENQPYKISSPAETNYGNLKNIQEGGKK